MAIELRSNHITFGRGCRRCNSRIQIDMAEGPSTQTASPSLTLVSISGPVSHLSASCRRWSFLYCCSDCSAAAAADRAACVWRCSRCRADPYFDWLCPAWSWTWAKPAALLASTAAASRRAETNRQVENLIAVLLVLRHYWRYAHGFQWVGAAGYFQAEGRCCINCTKMVACVYVLRQHMQCTFPSIQPQDSLTYMLIWWAYLRRSLERLRAVSLCYQPVALERLVTANQAWSRLYA